MIKKDRLIKTFLNLVQIDSPSGKEGAIVREVSQRLKKLKFIVKLDKYGNVIGHLDGNNPKNTETLLLNAHLDTVEPGKGVKPKIVGDRIVTDGKTVLGGDPKAGVSAILEAIESIKEDNKKHPPLDVVFTLSEETGLLGAINLDYSLLQAKKGITFDGEEEVNNIDISAPGYNRFDLIVIGRSAHAGVEPEKGISAIKIVSEIISKLQVGRIDHETTANIGLIEGGSARNAVPEKVTIKGEIRSRNLKKLEKLSQSFQKAIDQVILKYPKATFQLDLHREFNPYLFQENHQVIQLIKKVLKSMKLKPHLNDSMGGTDVNIFHNNGIEAIVVGTGDYNAHTTREYVQISQMLLSSKFCEKLITF